MDSVTVTVPLRPPAKKMKKRKELDALAPPHVVSRHNSGKRSSQELLSESSDERSDYWNAATTGRIRARKVRGREHAQGSSCRNLLWVCSTFLNGTFFLVTIIFIWLFLDVRQQVSTLRAELNQVIAGSEGVPDALQMCHTLEKNFKSNITYINSVIQKLNTSLNEFSKQISSFQQKLQEVQVSLKSAPELTSVPNTVKALQNSIGQLEIDINDLKTTYNMVKTSTLSLESSQNQQQDSLNNIKITLKDLFNIVQNYEAAPNNQTYLEREKLWTAIGQLSKNLTRINETLTINITWIKEDWANDHKKLILFEDMTQKMSAQILTLQQECIKTENLETLENLVNSLSNQVKKLNSDHNNNISYNTDKSNLEKLQVSKKTNNESNINIVKLISLPVNTSSQIVASKIKIDEILQFTPKVETLEITSQLPSTQETSVVHEVLPDIPSTTTNKFMKG